MDQPQMVSKEPNEKQVKGLKICKENRYYHKHREEILEKKLQKRLEDPEYKAKYDERLRKKAEREEVERQRAEKRELRKQTVELLLNPMAVSPGAI